MEKCIACNYYDRGAKETDSRGVQWGQCRRQAPMLHPVNQKTYMIEGVWPHVRDDDWSYAAHRRIFDAHRGAKAELAGADEVAAWLRSRSSGA